MIKIITTGFLVAVFIAPTAAHATSAFGFCPVVTGSTYTCAEKTTSLTAAELRAQIAKLQAQLAALEGSESDNTETISVKEKKTYVSSRQVGGSNGTPITWQGKYTLDIVVNSGDKPLYLPKTVGSDDDENGFVLQVEGSDARKFTSSIIAKTKGVTSVTVASTTYWKIPANKSIEFRITAQLEIKKGEEFLISLSRVNYKTDPKRSRLSDVDLEIKTDPIIRKK